MSLSRIMAIFISRSLTETKIKSFHFWKLWTISGFTVGPIVIHWIVSNGCAVVASHSHRQFPMKRKR
jgi:hypothetical protein